MLDQLEVLKKTFDATAQNRLSKLLSQLSKQKFKDAESIIRLHESLLFILAYPSDRNILAQAKAILASFPGRIDYLRKIDADMSLFEEPENSGIAGTSLTAIFGFKFSQWLAENHFKESEIDWEGYEEVERIGSTLHRALPLLEEESLVESHFPFLKYIHAAKPKNSNDLKWMINSFSNFDLTEKQKAELYEFLKLYIRITPGFKTSRTGLRSETNKIFFHKEALIQRREVSIDRELNLPPLKIKKLSVKEGLEILNIIRCASFVRFRELHGFIWADPKSFLKIDLGRGIIFYMNEVLPENRLPLRAYHSGFLFKNGIPVGYIEGISLFEKMEVGFNHYYTYRDGETAWIFSQMLRVFHQHLGVTVFSIDPYQIGHENEEGIESGAFWFYRKLGFHPLQKDVVKIVEGEEKKMSSKKDYRTPANILRKIAKSHLLYTHIQNNSIGNRNLGWELFQFRNVILAVQEKMSKRYEGNVIEMMKETTRTLSKLPGIDLNKINSADQTAIVNLSNILSIIPDTRGWSKDENKLFSDIIHAKGSRSEKQYLHLLQKHTAFRNALIRIGNKKTNKFS